MLVYHFNLPAPVMVSRVFSYLSKQLGADFTGYGGTGHDARDKEGNTLLELFDSENRIKYFINTYSGKIYMIGDEKTSRVSVEPVQGLPLDNKCLAIIQRGLESLTSSAAVPSAHG